MKQQETHYASGVSPECVSAIAEGIFRVIPLIKERLTSLKAIQLEEGIPLSHVEVLAMLAETGSMSVTEISQRFGIAKPNITPLVDRLVAAGLVDRVRSETDRRVVNVVILDAGRERLKSIDSALGEYITGWADRLTPGEFARLARALDDVTEILGKL